MCGENSVTQASPSAGEVNSTELTPKEKHRQYMRRYMKVKRAAVKAGTWVPGRQNKRNPNQGSGEKGGDGEGQTAKCVA